MQRGNKCSWGMQHSTAEVETSKSTREGGFQPGIKGAPVITLRVSLTAESEIYAAWMR